MKHGILTAVGLIVLLVLAVRFLSERRAEAQPAAPSQGNSAKGSADLTSLKELVFADDPLEKSAGLDKGKKQPDDSPFRRLASALSHVREGKPQEAKADLRQLLNSPETRVRLWAWRALRDLGDKPDPNAADKVQGVVCELSNEAGVGTMAAYEDGRARWLGGQGAATVWEAPGTNPEIDKAIRDLLQAAAPLVKTTPAAAQHQSSKLERDHFRVTVLTYGGVHIAEAYGPNMTETDALAPPLGASGSLVQALQKAGQKDKKSGR